jgi:hypothetical protein|tara:strand:+ start:368 stop:571 length:204 start_codon:yes stop_codon:yes gene_type:complete
MRSFALIEYYGKYYLLNYTNKMIFREKKMLEKVLKNHPFKKTRFDAVASARQKNGNIVFTATITPWR